MSTSSSILTILGIGLSVSVLATGCVAQEEEQGEAMPSAEDTAQEGEALQKAIQADATGPVLMACSGIAVTRFSPGLRLTPQPVTVTKSADYGPCVSTRDPAITSGTFAMAADVNTSCLTALEFNGGSETITWNTGETSTFTFTQTVDDVGGEALIVNTGTITAGKFLGATAVETTVNATINSLQCLLPSGLTEKTGTIELVITGP